METALCVQRFPITVLVNYIMEEIMMQQKIVLKAKNTVKLTFFFTVRHFPNLTAEGNYNTIKEPV